MDLKEQHIVWLGGAAILSMFGFAILTKCSPTSNVSMNRASLDKYSNDVEDENLTESEYYQKYPIVKLGGKRKSKKKRKNNIR
jgi:hypothetical protein